MSQATFPVQPISYFESKGHPWGRAVRALLIFGIVLGFISLATDYHTRFYNASTFFAFGERESGVMFTLCLGINAVLNFLLLSCSIAWLRFRLWALRGLVVWSWLRLLLGALGIAVVVATVNGVGGNHALDQFANIMLKALPQIGVEMRVLILPVLLLIVLRTDQVRQLFESNQVQ